MGRTLPPPGPRHDGLERDVGLCEELRQRVKGLCLGTSSVGERDPDPEGGGSHVLTELCQEAKQMIIISKDTWEKTALTVLMSEREDPAQCSEETLGHQRTESAGR